MLLRLVISQHSIHSPIMSQFLAKIRSIKPEDGRIIFVNKKTNGNE
jgi:hypothetical protein